MTMQNIAQFLADTDFRQLAELLGGATYYDVASSGRVIIQVDGRPLLTHAGPLTLLAEHYAGLGALIEVDAHDHAEIDRDLVRQAVIERYGLTPAQLFDWEQGFDARQDWSYDEYADSSLFAAGQQLARVLLTREHELAPAPEGVHAALRAWHPTRYWEEIAPL